MKTCILIAALTAATSAFAQKFPILMSGAYDGHTLESQIKTMIETNPAPSRIAGRIFIDDYFNVPVVEKPFPRTEESCDTFNVTSNVYAIFILDKAATNVMVQSSVKLGTLIRKTKTVITTQTNSVTTETFTP